MTIDERLDRLVERHEALSQSVEMLAVGQRELQKEMKAMIAAITLLAKTVANHEGRIGDLEGGRA